MTDNLDRKYQQSHEDKLLRKTLTFINRQTISETVTYSSQLEAFIRKIAREEIETALTEYTNGFIKGMKNG